MMEHILYKLEQVYTKDGSVYRVQVIFAVRCNFKYLGFIILYYYAVVKDMEMKTINEKKATKAMHGLI